MIKDNEIILKSEYSNICQGSCSSVRVFHQHHHPALCHHFHQHNHQNHVHCSMAKFMIVEIYYGQKSSLYIPTKKQAGICTALAQ